MKPFFEQRQVDGTLAMSAMGAMITGGAMGLRCCILGMLPWLQACPGMPARCAWHGSVVLPSRSHSNRPPCRPLAGGLSRTLAAVAACPFTIVKTRMEYSGAGG